MYTVYILQSLKRVRYYVGHCEDLPVRLKRHNSGKVRSTKYDCPWKVVRTQEYATKQEAYARERQIKSYKGGEAFKRLLTATAFGGVPPTAGESSPAHHSIRRNERLTHGLHPSLRFGLRPKNTC